MKPREIFTLLALSAIWGASYLFIRIAAPLLGSVVLASARLLIGGGLVLAYAVVIGQKPELRQRWKMFLLLGAINSALPMTLIGIAVSNLNASISAVINATVPLFTSLVAAIWLKDKLRPKQLAGIALGLAGVIVLMGWSPLPLTPAVLLAALLAVLAALCYGIGNVFVRVGFKGVPTLTMTIAQQLFAGTLLLPLAMANAPAAHPTPLGLFAALALGLLCTGFAYMLYFRLIGSLGPTRTAVYAYMVPFFSILWGGIFLGEPLSAGLVGGLAIILFSVALVTGVIG